MKRYLLVAAALGPLAGLAQEPPIPIRYDYVDASLAVPALDEIGLDLEGATTVARDLIVFGRYLNYEPNNRVDLSTFQIGVGRVWNVRRNVDFIASASYSKNEIDTPTRVGVEDEGIVLGGQLRGWATNRIELSGAIMLDNSKGSSTDTVVELGVQYLTEPRLSYGGRVRVDEDDTTISGGLRFYFGASRRPLPR
jgi:hypothetical protein